MKTHQRRSISDKKTYINDYISRIHKECIKESTSEVKDLTLIQLKLNKRLMKPLR